MRIYGCVSGYDEADNLHRCLKSIRSLVDVLVYTDGRYFMYKPQGIPENDGASTDGSVEIALGLCDVVITNKEPWRDEIHKRNSYLIAEPGDWYLVVDGDEEFQGVLEPDVFMAQGGDRGLVMVPEIRDTTPVAARSRMINPILRLFKARRGLHYHGTHHALWAPVDGRMSLLNNTPALQVLAGGFLLHHHECRSSERVETKGEYFRHIQEVEGEFRKINKL